MKPDLLADATRLEEHFQPGSVDYIYCGHFLEHLTVPEGRLLVQSFFRLLRDYGSVVFVIPDFTKCSEYTIEEQDSIIIADGLHKSLMNADRMRSYLEGAGFLTVVEAMNLSNLNHCPFPQVKWQSGMIGIKHEQVKFLIGR